MTWKNWFKTMIVLSLVAAGAVGLYDCTQRHAAQVLSTGYDYQRIDKNNHILIWASNTEPAVLKRAITLWSLHQDPNAVRDSILATARNPQ